MEKLEDLWAQHHAEVDRGMREMCAIELHQALWDKVAVAAIPAVIRMGYTMANEETIAEYAARYADAFMTERAKRLKGGV